MSKAEKNILHDVGLRKIPNRWVIASSPGRADFLNTHQDYKLLPVVPVALELRTYVAGGIIDGNDVSVKSLTMKRAGEDGEDRFNI
jgi:galactokinase